VHREGEKEEIVNKKKRKQLRTFIIYMAKTYVTDMRVCHIAMATTDL